MARKDQSGSTSGDVPLYEKIRQHLLEQIRHGHLRPGDLLPSEAELAQQFGVSRITSKHALVLLAQQGIIQRQPGKGSFVTEVPGGQESSPRRTLGIIMPHLTTRHELELLRGAEAEAAKQGYTLVLGQSSGLQENEERVVKDLLDAGVDALIIWPVDGDFYNPALLRMSMTPFPTVLVDRRLNGVPLSAVVSDNREGARQAARHLLELGHRQIGIIGPPAHLASSIADRLFGFGVGLWENGIPYREEFWLTDLSHDIDENRARVKEFLARFPEITGILAVNTLGAVAAYKAAQDLGRSLPDDLSIVSFDQPDWIGVQGIPFAHIAQHAEEMGRQATQLILSELSSERRIPRCEKVPVHFVPGQTSAPRAK